MPSTFRAEPIMLSMLGVSLTFIYPSPMSLRRRSLQTEWSQVASSAMECGFRQFTIPTMITFLWYLILELLSLCHRGRRILFLGILLAIQGWCYEVLLQQPTCWVLAWFDEYYAMIKENNILLKQKLIMFLMLECNFWVHNATYMNVMMALSWLHQPRVFFTFLAHKLLWPFAYGMGLITNWTSQLLTLFRPWWRKNVNLIRHTWDWPYLILTIII